MLSLTGEQTTPGHSCGFSGGSCVSEQACPLSVCLLLALGLPACPVCLCASPGNPTLCHAFVA